MTRLVTGRSAELVDVRCRDGVPEQFLWRGRLYLVHEVLTRWTEAGGWWRADLTGVQPSGVIEDGEQECWRVEAGSGRLAVLTAGLGVYELRFTWSTGTWALVRVQD